MTETEAPVLKKRKFAFLFRDISALWIFLICLIMLFVTININWGGKNKNLNIIRSDAKCYYLYLPGVFIYHDLNFRFTDQIEFETYYDKNNCLDCRQYDEGRAYSKVTAGVAMVQIPFFLAAHAYALISGYPADGYSRPYQLMPTIAALFYLFLGLWFLNNLVKTYHISAKSRVIMMLCCVFGTNLFYYSVGEPGLSHVYSFAFINMLAYNIRLFFIKGNMRFIIYSALICGIIFLIRPVNMIILPGLLVFAGDFQQLKQKTILLKHKFTSLLIAIFCFLAIVSIQVILFKLQTGKYWIFTYGNEGFNFSKPEIFNILFSYKKGLFLYTPMYLVSFAGIYYLFRKQKLSGMLLLVFLFIFTYVVSSWWNWWYGGSFSSRVYVDILAFFMLPLAFLIDAIKSKIRKILLILCLFLLVSICQIQTYQYRYYKIHWENMTKEKYWDNFLRIDQL